MKKLAIITTHPIQYNAPLFQLLAKEKQFEIKVFYTWSQKQTDSYDQNFGTNVDWDIPLLEGYDYSFVENQSKKPGNKHFKGIKCPDLISRIENWGASHVLVYGWNFQAHLKAMRYFKGKIPVWFRGDSHLLDEEQGLKKILRRAFLTWVFRYMDKALYVGANNKKYYQKHGLKETQLVFAPHAIDNQRFIGSISDNYEEKALAWRKDLGIKKEDFVILFCGKFEPKKNPLLLLEAFLNLQKKSPRSLKLLFIGNGILKEDLKKTTGDNPDIIYLPFQNQSLMPAVYRLANLFCLPSQGPGETWGLAVNEALASGRTVLVSDKVGCAIDLINKDNGKIFKSNDRPSLEKSISEMIKQTYHTETIRASVEEWSFSKITQVIQSLLLND